MIKIKKAKELPLVTIPSTRHYYVDEAGDATLFDARGRVLIGTPGCSSHFLIGLLSAFEPISLEADLRALNRTVLADASLNWRGSYKKPTTGFHANDDLPEVRELVFALLMKQKFRFFAVVKDKQEALRYVREMNRIDPQFHYDGDNLYDSLVASLFQTRLHKNYEHNVYFASRGHTDRTAALRTALIAVQTRAKAQLNPSSTGSMKIFPATTPSKNVNLQAVDYCLWAAQRYYARKEEKYLKMILPSVSMIYEIDSRKICSRKKHPFGC